MTNDLNTIPASVRDILKESISIEPARAINTGQALENCIKAIEPKDFLAQSAVSLIELLCQPNIVIVDLNDEKLMDIMDNAFWDNANQQNRFENYDSKLAIKAALAALKEG